MMQTLKDNYFDELDQFTVQDGFAIAFGLINDAMDLAELTPDIGSL